jgi:hypothetical protein
MPDEVPIRDDEVLYRRIPVSMENWCDGTNVFPEAFGPTKHDDSGLSVYRKRFKSLSEVAKGKSKKGYYVAEICVSDLRRAGIAILPRPNVPDGHDDAHAELPEITYADRKSDKVLELQRRLAEFSTTIHGPFTD